MAYEYIPKAHYAPSNSFSELIKDLANPFIVVQDNNVSSVGFNVKLSGSVFDVKAYRYIRRSNFYDGGGFQTAKSAWNVDHNPLGLWDTQLNFATHCATSALDVSAEHMNASELMVKPLYRFHANYHIRRILKRMQAPLPNERGCDKYNNSFSLEEVERIGREYGVSTKS